MDFLKAEVYQEGHHEDTWSASAILSLISEFVFRDSARLAGFLTTFGMTPMINTNVGETIRVG